MALSLFSCKKDKNEKTQESPQLADALTDKGWPREIERDGAKLVYYQPQIDAWKDFKTVSGDIAFSLTKDKRQVMGIASVEAGTLVDKESRQVYFKDIKINDLRFPTLAADSVQVYYNLVKELFPKNGNPISIDRLLAEVQKNGTGTASVDVKNDPPTIFFSASPAIMLLVPGNPALAPVENTNLQYVVNANWDLFFDKASKDYYLLAGNFWLKSRELSGNWASTTAIPDEMKKLPSGQGFDDVKKEVPAKPIKHATPKVFFSSKPAELVLIDGSPKYASIPGTGLSYVENTENDVFRDDSTNTYYLLLSGRWFAARSFNGPWAYAGNSLPEGFAKIPEKSPMGHVLSSVPGTQQASDAVLLAQVPTTAIVNKAEVEKKVKVHYDGDPQFKPIEKTSLQYATNTQEKIIKDGDLYYLCFQGVWFMSASANGPWKTAPSVPNEIYNIPPSSPVYNVTYVTQTEVNDTTVESNTTAGYFGMFVIGATVGAMLCYGTGFYYPPYMYWGPMYSYPVYRPWPMTYGAGAIYNPWTGGYAAGRRVYGPYGSAGTSAWYNPATGRYGRSASVQGWYGGRTSASTYNPWTGGYGHTNQGHNAYAQWGNSVASRGGDWVKTGHINTRNGGAFAYQTSGGKEGVITRGPAGNTRIHTNNGVYAGHDGNVYKKDNNGSWSKYDKGKWDKVNHNISGQTQHTRPANTIGGATQKKGEGLANRTAQPSRQNQNLGGETRTIPNRAAGQNLGGETRNIPNRAAGQNIGGETRQLPNRTDNNLGGVTQRTMPDRNLGGQTDVMDNLQRSDAARQRGEQQTQRFNDFQRNNGGASRQSGGFGGGGMRGGGGGRFGRH